MLRPIPKSGCMAKDNGGTLKGLLAEHRTSEHQPVNKNNVNNPGLGVWLSSTALVLHA